MGAKKDNLIDQEFIFYINEHTKIFSMKFNEKQYLDDIREVIVEGLNFTKPFYFLTNTGIIIDQEDEKNFTLSEIMAADFTSHQKFKIQQLLKSIIFFL